MTLLTTHYSIQRVTCILNETTDVDNHTHVGYIPLPVPFRMGYIFTIVIYAFLSVLRLTEYIVLGIATLKFLVADKELVKTYVHTFKKNKGKVTKFTLAWSVLLCPCLLLAIVIPTFGVIQELEYDKKVAPCHNSIEAVYVAYSAVNYLRYLCAFSVRMALIITTVIIREIWEEEAKKYRENLPNLVENGGNQRYFNDWDNTANRLQHWTKEYKTKGDKIKEIVEIFQTWFIIPWVIFFIASSLDANQILQPWNIGSTMTRTYYLLYNINQLITLLVPFLCATYINLYHHNFYKDMKKDLLYDCGSPGQQAIAHMFIIEKEEEFNFVSRIVCTDIKIRVDNPLYILFLLLGLFFTVCKTLL